MYQNRETVGQRLKRERESHRVPVEEIALFVGVDRSLIDALEGDDFDGFPGRGECLRLVKQITAYLKLNQAEVLRLFDEQWKLTGGVKRYPKLTQFADGDASPAGSALFKIKGHVRRLPARGGWLTVVVGILILGAVLLIAYPDAKREPTPPNQRAASGTAIKVLPVKAPAPPPMAVPEERTVSPGRPSRPQSPQPGSAVAERKIPPQPKGAKVIGNRDSKRYHLPGMKYYDLVKEYHRVFFQSEGDAIRAGYRKARE
ncbi:MAG: helix-turn-helix domain-containing protein [Syntrophales bacterium]